MIQKCVASPIESYSDVYQRGVCSFDILLAILFPILVFAYCYSNFELDREVILLNMELFPPGAFERSARMTANPAQLALFRLLFDSLRIQTPLDFVLRISMNLSVCFRFKRMIEIFVQSRKRFRFSRRQFRYFYGKSPSVRHSKQSLPWPIALILFAFSATLVVSTFKAISSSNTLCKQYPECALHAYQWQLGSSNPSCPCLALIDAIRVPTQEDWENPRDVADLVRQLASPGLLQILHIINRRLVDLPDELQKCTDLRYM